MEITTVKYLISFVYSDEEEITTPPTEALVGCAGCDYCLLLVLRPGAGALLVELHGGLRLAPDVDVGEAVDRAHVALPVQVQAAHVVHSVHRTRLGRQPLLGSK